MLNRKKNAGILTVTAFNTALHKALTESRRFRVMPVRSTLLDQSIHHILTHNLNSTDAVHLASAWEAYQLAQAKGHSVVLVSADQRLLRAGAAEGLVAFDPETGTDAQLRALMG